MKKQNGITLISLIITIIIMLILAGVSLSMVMGDGSILDQANAAANNTKIAEVQEYINLAAASNKMAKYTKTGLKSKDTLAAEMKEQGLITEEEKQKILNDEEITISGTVIDFSGLETTYNDAINSGVTEDNSAITLSGVWKLNDVVYYANRYADDTYINFTSNGTAFNCLMMEDWGVTNGFPYKLVYYGSGMTYVCTWNIDSNEQESFSWDNEAYRTLDFGSTPQEVTQEFYDWFTANATRN